MAAILTRPPTFDKLSAMNAFLTAVFNGAGMPRPARIVMVIATTLIVAGSAATAAKTTSSTGAGNWMDPIWNNGTPSNGDVVAVGHNIILTNATPDLASFTQMAGTFTFSGSNAVVTAQLVSVAGTLTHNANSDTNGADNWQVDNRVLIACSNFTLSGTVNLSAKGFPSNPYYEVAPGNGPGGGQGMYGAGYGGIGGPSFAPGATYGSASDPQWPGSSGGNRDSGVGRRGGFGGGLFILRATGHVAINGTINVNGENSPEATWGGGGGSGGGVNIRCATFAATNATITANGGYGSTFAGGSGGGGRIAISITNATTQNALPIPRVTFTARYGTVSGPTIPPYFFGDYGTVYIDHQSLMPAVMTGFYGYYYGPVASNWTLGSLALTNCWIRFATNLNATVSGDLRLSDSILYGLRTTAVGGNIIVTNNSSISFYGNPTNGVSPDWGTLVSITGTLAVASNCYVYTYSDMTNGGSVFFQLDNLYVANGGTISADQAGFAGGNPNGYGPGRGTNGFGGAGYGGTGGRYSTYGGATYGSDTNPIHAGSGGAGAGTSIGKTGGGLIHIVATHEIAIHGTLTANGGSTVANNICAGSGGGIYLWADVFASATGIIRAEGGNGYGNFGGGGGGRIARLYRNDGFAGTTSVARGTGGSYPGQVGTIYTGFSGPYATFTLQGSPARHGTPVPYGYGKNGATTGVILTNTVNSPADEINNSRYRCIGWQLTNDAGAFNSGAGTQAVVTITTNTTLTWLWTNEYHLAALAGLNGHLQTDVSGWYTHGDTTQLVPVADPGFYFSQWLGTYAPASWTTTPLPVTMDRPRTVTACFGKNGGETINWVGSSGDWTVASNWSSGSVPALQDTAVISSGAVALPESPRITALIMSGNGRLTTASGANVILHVQGEMTIGSAAQVTLNAGELTVDGSLQLWGTAKLYINSGITNTASPNYGARVRMGGDLTVSSGCWIYPQSENTNGGSVYFEMRDLNVESGGGIDANGRGFRGGLAPVDPGGPTVGWGYGGGNFGEGGGYGGRGGRYSAPYGLTYASSTNPIHAGSGGGGNNGNPYRSGGNGGGLVRITASRIIKLLGAIQANGNAGGGDYYSGGGSGGGIYIRCWTLTGDGVLSANGGAGHPAGPGGAGGGGRIAIYRTNHKFVGPMTVDRGGTVTAPDAEVGTIYLGYVPPSGTTLTLK